MMHPGQTFTIEPMVNAGASKDFTWPDDWTAVSQVRICLKLTQIYADLAQIWRRFAQIWQIWGLNFDGNFGQDGSRSAQFEHTLLVTETGVEILTARLPTSRADVATNYRGEVV